MKPKFLKKYSYFAIPLLAVVLVLCSQERSFLKSISIVNKNKIVEEDKDSLASALKLQQALRNIASSVSPAVVNIRTEKKVKVKSQFDDFFNDPMFKRFFGEEDGGGRPQERKQQASGSGMLISEDGYILTNNHVVQGADKITIFLSDKRTYNGKIIGSDEKTDIALVKVDTKGHSLPAVALGDSTDIQVGDFAIAIGNPFGLNWTFTFGVISATGRTEAIDENAPYKSYIQTDVSINPGNSGGPLLNIKGQVIGINSAIFSTSGGSIGIGFAVPINIAKNVVKQLMEKGKVERGYLGAFIQDIDEKLAKYYKLDKSEGIILTSIEKNSPAEKAGLKSGDVVISINGKRVGNANQLISIISNTAPGENLNLTIIRSEKQMNVDVQIGKRDEAVALLDSGGHWLGMKFGDLNSYRDKMNLPNSIRKGLVVIDVNRDSGAAEVGIRQGDVIDMLNNQSIDNLEEFKKFLSDNKNKSQYLLRVIRNNRIYFVALENK